MCDPAAGIAETNGHSQAFAPGDHGQFFTRLFLHGALTVFGQVEEDLHQALAVRPHGRQIVFYLPADGNPGIPQRRLDHDTQLIQQGLHLHPRRVARGLPQVHRCNALQRQHQRTQGLKVLIFCQACRCGTDFHGPTQWPRRRCAPHGKQRPP